MIAPILPSNNITFDANLNSPKLKFKHKDFFVRIRGYGKDREWAQSVIKSADTAVNLIRRNTEPENVLKIISTGIRNANLSLTNILKKKYSGILRTKRDFWLYDDKENNKDTKLLTYYASNQYKSYKERLDKRFSLPLDTPNESIGITRVNNSHCLIHGHWSKINSSLDCVFDLTKKIIPKYLKKEVKKENLEEINSTIAEIRWILAHSTPWIRGSDAISNVFMRALYKAIGIKTYPLKEGVSLDLEAYCTNLNDYKKNFPKYFEQTPIIIE